MLNHQSLSHLSNVFFKNFFYGGLALGAGLTFVEYFKKQSELVYLYAYITSSFFLVQLYKYYFINNSIPELAHGFILHSIIGGIVYVVFIIFMLYLFKIYQSKKAHGSMFIAGELQGIDKISSNKLMIWNVVVYLLTIVVYHIMLKLHWV